MGTQARRAGDMGPDSSFHYVLSWVGEVLFVSSMAAVSSWHKWLSSFSEAWKRGLELCCRVKVQIFGSIRSPKHFLRVYTSLLQGFGLQKC